LDFIKLVLVHYLNIYDSLTFKTVAVKKGWSCYSLSLNHPNLIAIGQVFFIEPSVLNILALLLITIIELIINSWFFNLTLFFLGD